MSNGQAAVFYSNLQNEFQGVVGNLLEGGNSTLIAPLPDNGTIPEQDDAILPVINSMVLAVEDIFLNFTKWDLVYGSEKEGKFLQFLFKLIQGYNYEGYVPEHVVFYFTNKVRRPGKPLKNVYKSWFWGKTSTNIPQTMDGLPHTKIIEYFFAYLPTIAELLDGKFKGKLEDVTFSGNFTNDAAKFYTICLKLHNGGVDTEFLPQRKPYYGTANATTILRGEDLNTKKLRDIIYFTAMKWLVDVSPEEQTLVIQSVNGSRFDAIKSFVGAKTNIEESSSEAKNYFEFSNWPDLPDSLFSLVKLARNGTIFVPAGVGDPLDFYQENNTRYFLTCTAKAVTLKGSDYYYVGSFWAYHKDYTRPFSIIQLPSNDKDLPTNWIKIEFEGNPTLVRNETQFIQIVGKPPSRSAYPSSDDPQPLAFPSFDTLAINFNFLRLLEGDVLERAGLFASAFLGLLKVGTSIKQKKGHLELPDGRKVNVEQYESWLSGFYKTPEAQSLKLGRNEWVQSIFAKSPSEEFICLQSNQEVNCVILSAGEYTIWSKRGIAMIHNKDKNSCTPCTLKAKNSNLFITPAHPNPFVLRVFSLLRPLESIEDLNRLHAERGDEAVIERIATLLQVEPNEIEDFEKIKVLDDNFFHYQEISRVRFSCRTFGIPQKSDGQISALRRIVPSDDWHSKNSYMTAIKLLKPRSELIGITPPRFENATKLRIDLNANAYKLNKYMLSPMQLNELWGSLDYKKSENLYEYGFYDDAVPYIQGCDQKEVDYLKHMTKDLKYPPEVAYQKTVAEGSYELVFLS